MNIRIILYTLGWVLNLEAAAMILPLICSLCYGESPVPFLISIALTAVLGIAFTVKKPKNISMYSREGYTSVALSWVVLSIMGALPFFISGYIPNFMDAVFETVSGFTTTGASILTDVEALPKGLLFWRSFTHWLGGMGIIVFLIALLPLFGGSNLYLIKAESPGPSVSKLVPKVKSTAKILYSIYLSFTVIEIILLLIGKMSVFDALTTTFGTAGTGGFGVKNSSMADYSPYIQNVVTVFMLIFGVDFSIYYLLLVKKFSSAVKSTELRTYLGIVLTSAIIIAFNCRHLFANIWTALHHAFFQVASLMTTTGYATANFDTWPSLSKAILLTLMFIGACAGSTGGGIKVSRIVILVKSIFKEIRITAHPKSTLKITMNGNVIEHETLRAVNVYMAAYLLIVALSILIISIDNFDFETNFTAVASALNNIGPGFSKVGPAENFSIFSNLSTFVLALDMLIGRLEIFPMLMLLSPCTWKK